MSVTAIAKRKGGVGASTLAAALAGAWDAEGCRVVVLDADPQRSCVTWAGLADDPEAVLPRCVRDAVTDDMRALRELIEKARTDAERVIIDVPPGMDAGALLAAQMADLVLLPCGPSPLDLTPMRDALEVLHAVRGDAIKPRFALVPMRFTSRTRLGRELPAALAGVAEAVGTEAEVLPPGLALRVAYAETVLAGLTPAEWGKPIQDEAAQLARAVGGLLDGA